MKITSEPITIGIIGGGQLCRMMCEAASPLGFRVVFLDPTSSAPAESVAHKQITGDFDSAEDIQKLLDHADYLTYDIELADPDSIDALEPSVPVHPAPETLRMIQDKLNQKQQLKKRGIPVPDFVRVDSIDDLYEAQKQFGLPMMLKARMGGYDGRGNLFLDSEDDFEEALETLSTNAMVEELIDFDRELSIIGVKGTDGTEVFPVTETVHEEEILRHTITPARTTDEIKDRAREVARDVLEVMTGRGVYGIELFETDGKILVNEIAPRPHNSGHWTIEGAVTSQFEQHLRAVTGCPLGSTRLREPTVSVNILGDKGERPVSLEGIEALFETPDAHFHWYGKELERPLRKMGHFTVTGDDTEQVLNKALDLCGELSFKP
ncbi:MAG: 5-(carboxyamino)imidazole ribonucleotide synthase [bacterium]